MGHIYYPDGTPASNAIVQLIAADQDPRTSSLVAATVTTDVNGRYSIKSLTAKTYNLLAEGDSGKAFHDSIKVDDDTLELSDTLHDPGILRGIVKLEGDIDTGYIFVILLGTNTYATADTNGNFTLADMPAGTYNTLVLTTVPEYASVDTELTVHVGADEWMNDTIFLRNTGVPIPENLSITYDTLRQIVTLTWAKADTALVKSYNVYRRNVDSNTILTRINASPITDTFYTDNTLSKGATYEYVITALDRQSNEGNKSLVISMVFQNRFNLSTSTPAFGPNRHYHSSVVFNNKMWVIAGEGINNARMNDVWSSIYGINWILETDSASFSKREQFASVVFNGKMWVIGGYDGNLMNDVWYSADGISWNQATDSAAFSKRDGHMAVSFNNKIWVIGGNDGNNYQNDVWSSPDGVTWTQVTGAAAFPGRSSSAAVVFDSAIWIFSGYVNQIIYSKDAWYSNDGVNWTQLQTPPEYGGRFGHTSVVFNNRIWIIGKISNQNTSDVWYLQ